MSMFSTASRSVTPGLLDRALERIEVHADQVDRLDALRLEGRHVVRVVAAREQRGVEPRVQGLHAPVEDLRRAGELGDVGDLEARVADRRRGAAGGEDLRRRARAARGRSRRSRSCPRPRSARSARGSGSRPAGSRPPARSPLRGSRSESNPPGSSRRDVPGSISTRPAAIIRIASRQQRVLGRVDRRLERVAVAVRRHRDRRAGAMIGPESTPSSTKWTVTPVIRTPCSSAWPIASEPGERRQEGRVHVDDPVGEPAHERRARAAACSRRARRARRRAHRASRRSPGRAPRGRG